MPIGTPHTSKIISHSDGYWPACWMHTIELVGGGTGWNKMIHACRASACKDNTSFWWLLVCHWKMVIVSPRVLQAHNACILLRRRWTRGTASWSGKGDIVFAAAIAFHIAPLVDYGAVQQGSIGRRVIMQEMNAIWLIVLTTLWFNLSTVVLLCIITSFKPIISLKHPKLRKWQALHSLSKVW